MYPWRRENDSNGFENGATSERVVTVPFFFHYVLFTESQLLFLLNESELVKERRAVGGTIFC